MPGKNDRSHGQSRWQPGERRQNTGGQTSREVARRLRAATLLARITRIWLGHRLLHPHGFTTGHVTHCHFLSNRLGVLLSLAERPIAARHQECCQKQQEHRLVEEGGKPHGAIVIPMGMVARSSAARSRLGLHAQDPRVKWQSPPGQDLVQTPF